MECKNARLLMDFLRPAAPELDAEETQALQDHLQDCPDCRALAEFERRLDEHLGRAMRDVPLPAGLQVALMRRLDVQRDGLYKQWAWRALAAAAVVVLALGLGWYAFLGRKPAPDMDDFAAIADEASPASADRVEGWLHAVARKDLPAPPFQSSLLIGCGFGKVKGRLVPMLTYVRGTAWARVYVLDDRQFDLEALRGQAAPSGVKGVSLRVLADPDPNPNPHVLYVVIFHGTDEGPEFFMKPLPGAVALRGPRIAVGF